MRDEDKEGCKTLILVLAWAIFCFAAAANRFNRAFDRMVNRREERRAMNNIVLALFMLAPRACEHVGSSTNLGGPSE